MASISIYVKRFVFPLLLALLLAACFIPYQKGVVKRTTLHAQADTDQESVRLAAKEGVEITNGRFKLFVYFDNIALNMRLFVPEGEELFVIEPFVELIETTTQQELEKIEVNWFHLDSKLDDGTGRLIGVMSEPPATVYAEMHFIRTSKPDDEEIDLRFPVFKTKGNEIIKFADVTFRFTTTKKYLIDGIMLPVVF